MGIKKQYQTIIVACAFTLLFVNTGFTSTSFSIYQSYIVDIPGVGDVGGSVVVTVRTFVSLICMFFTGVYFRRLNPRIGFFIATLFTALAFFLFGRAYSLAGLCVASAFAGIGYGFGGMVASTYLIGATGFAAKWAQSRASLQWAAAWLLSSFRSWRVG